MKHMKWLFVAITSAIFMVACGSSNNDNGESSGGAIPYSCPIGSYWSGSACISNTNGNAVTTDFVAENWYYKTMQITNSSVYKEVLKNAMGVCDRGSWNTGTASCDSWIGGYISVVLQVQSGTAARIYITAYPASTSWINGSAGWLSGNGYYQTLPLDLVLSNINNSQGFEGRGYGAGGTYAYNSLFQLIVRNGKVNDGYFDFQLAFGNQNTGSGQVFATGRLTRCQSAGCVNY